MELGSMGQQPEHGAGAGAAADPERRMALAAVAPSLRCPVCAGPVRLAGGQLRCDSGHGFDIARQGYVTLISGRPGPGTADSAAMVMARERFLSAGHYQPVAEAVAAMAARSDRSGPGLVADLAGGTGYYLARVLDALPDRAGVCFDLSAPALRRAARAHPRAAAVGADVWAPLPLATDSAALVLSVFGPRNASEIRRVLAPGATLIVAVPGPSHLRELRDWAGIIGIDEHKRERLARALGDCASLAAVSCRLSLDHAALTDLVAMGPSARHIGPGELASRVAAQPSPVTVTVDLEVRAYRPGALSASREAQR